MIKHQKNCWTLSANSLVMITKQQIRINYIEEISIKSEGKKVKYYQMSKKLYKAFGQLSGHYQKTTN